MSQKRKQTSISGFFPKSASKIPKTSSNESQPEKESEEEILAVAGPSNLDNSVQNSQENEISAVETSSIEPRRKSAKKSFDLPKFSNIQRPHISNNLKHTEGQKNDATANRDSIDEKKIVEIENESENSIENVENTSETRNSNIHLPVTETVHEGENNVTEIVDDETSEQINFSANKIPN